MSFTLHCTEVASLNKAAGDFLRTKRFLPAEDVHEKLEVGPARTTRCPRRASRLHQLVCRISGLPLCPPRDTLHHHLQHSEGTNRTLRGPELTRKMCTYNWRHLSQSPLTLSRVQGDEHDGDRGNSLC